jgi:hypothetical protein
MFRVGALFGVLSLVSVALAAAQPPEPTTATGFRRVIRISGTLAIPVDAPSRTETVTFAIYAEERGGTPLWQETQTVTVDQGGAYNALLGATAPDGLPLEIFTTNDARWLSIHLERANGPEQPRLLIASVAYALRAADADTLGGRPASAYVLADRPPDAPPAADDTTSKTAAGTAPRSSTATLGTAGRLGMFVDASNLGDSVVAQSGPRIGVGTANPADYLHVAFSDQFGAFTGLAVQNLSGNANASSGMLFFDQNGALAQFQGFNNVSHEYRINNIATGGSINFLIGSGSKFLVQNNGDISISGNLLRSGGLFMHTTGTDQTLFVGPNAGNLTNTGSLNVGVGSLALASITDGIQNTAVGASALTNNATGIQNTAVGGQALLKSTGNANTAVGAITLVENLIGGRNVAVGEGALYFNTFGNNNVALGWLAGSSQTTGSNNIYLGGQVSGVAGESNTIYIGNGGHTKTLIGGIRGVTTGLADAVAVVVDSSGQLGTINSSRRYKEDIQDMGDASSGLMKLRPVTFRYTQPYADGSKPIDYGLIAEEVEQLYPDLVAHLANGDVETVQYHKINAMLLNEVQKQHAELERQQNEIAALKARLEALERVRP